MTLFAAAREGLARARWLEGAEVVVADDLELDPVEVEFVAALAAALPVRVLRRALPPSLRPASFRGRLAARGVAEADWSDTPLAPLAPPPPPASLVACARGSSRRAAGTASRRTTARSSSSPHPARRPRCGRSPGGCCARPPAA